MSALKSANKELKGMMKTVKIEDVDVRSFWLLFCQFIFIYSFYKLCLLLEQIFFYFKVILFPFLQNLQDEMMDLMDVSNEIQESLGRSYSVPDDIDEEDLMGG